MQWKDALEILLFVFPLILIAPRYGYWLARRLDQDNPTIFEYNFFIELSKSFIVITPYYFVIS